MIAELERSMFLAVLMVALICSLVGGHRHPSPLTLAFLPTPPRYHPPCFGFFAPNHLRGHYIFGGISSPVSGERSRPLNQKRLRIGMASVSVLHIRLRPPRAPRVPGKGSTLYHLLGAPGAGGRHNRILSGRPTLLQLSIGPLKHVPITVFPLHQAAAARCPASSLAKTSNTHPPPHHQYRDGSNQSRISPRPLQLPEHSHLGCLLHWVLWLLTSRGVYHP